MNKIVTEWKWARWTFGHFIFIAILRFLLAYSEWFQSNIGFGNITYIKVAEPLFIYNDDYVISRDIYRLFMQTKENISFFKNKLKLKKKKE